MNPHRQALCFLLLPFISCTQYDYLAQLDYQQIAYDNEVDILFITDNSSSMSQENEALKVNFDRFIHNLIEAQETDESRPHEDLGDAVESSLYYVGNFTRFVDFHLSMTTTEVPAVFEWEGQSGTLVLGEILDNQTPNITDKFGDIVDDVLYHPAKAGEEKGLEVLRLTICKGLDKNRLEAMQSTDLPINCADISWSDLEEDAPQRRFFRPGSTLGVVITTDEGDFSYDRDSDLTVDDFLAFTEAAGIRLVASVIGPTVPDEAGEGCNPVGSAAGPPYCCNPNGSPYAMVHRYRDLVKATGGIYEPICDTNDGYLANPNFADTLDDIGLLLSGLQNRFQLSRTPDVSSIEVIVNDTRIAEDPANGWVYLRVGDAHVVEFRGSALPSYEARVDIYYRSIDGDEPRTLPF